MLQITRRTGFMFVSATIVLLSSATAPQAEAALTNQNGALSDGGNFLIEVPAPWNGTLLLYRHGYVAPLLPNVSNPARDVGDPATRAFLLANGFALAGSSYANKGWAIQEALLDQIAVLDIFDASFGHPKHTIAWGHSLGGIITAGRVQKKHHPLYSPRPLCVGASWRAGT